MPRRFSCPAVSCAGDIFFVHAGQSVPCDAAVLLAEHDCDTSTCLLVQECLPEPIISWRNLVKEMSTGDVILLGDTVMQGTAIAIACATGESSRLAQWQSEPRDLESVCRYAWQILVYFLLHQILVGRL